MIHIQQIKSYRIMDPLSVPASFIALGGAGTGVATALRAFYKNFREAPDQMLHAQRKCLQAQTNHMQLNNLPQQLREPYSRQIRSEMSNLYFLTDLTHVENEWAMSGRGKVDADISRLKEAESSTILTLSVAAFKEVWVQIDI